MKSLSSLIVLVLLFQFNEAFGYVVQYSENGIALLLDGSGSDGEDHPLMVRMKTQTPDLWGEFQRARGIIPDSNGDSNSTATPTAPTTSPPTTTTTTPPPTVTYTNCGSYAHGSTWTDINGRQSQTVACPTEHSGSKAALYQINQPKICDNGTIRDNGTANLTFLQYSSDTCVDRQIIGNIDSITRNVTGHYLNGWACSKNTASSVRVSILGGSTVLGDFDANRTSESAISNICLTGSTPHRFMIHLTPYMISYGNQLITVQVTSTVSVNKISISNSGQLRIPRPSVRWASSSPLGDFNGDRYADFADYSKTNGYFWIHQNMRNGTFSTSNYGESACRAESSSWRVLVGDFTGDGLADCADYSVNDGYFWVHRNLGNGRFDTANFSYGQVTASANVEILVADINGDRLDDIVERNLLTGVLLYRRNYGAGGGNRFPAMYYSSNTGFYTQVGSEWKILMGDFNGDRQADVAEVNTSTGYIWVHTGTADGQFNQGNYSPNGHSGKAMVGAKWKIIVGDFTGDGYTDFADLDTTNGYFWVHRNLGVNFDTQVWGQAQSYRPNSSWKILGE